MRPRSAFLRAFLVLSAGLLLLLGAPATSGADPPGLDSLRERSSQLETQSRAAVVELYALESRLASAQSELGRLQERAAAIKGLQRAAQRRYVAARRTLSVAQRRLGEQLRLLYQSDEPDPLAVLLGATSLSEALEGLENLTRTARLTEQVIERTRKAKADVVVDRRLLAERRAAAERSQTRATEGLRVLLAAHSERTSYLARLRNEQQLTANQISGLEARAQEAQQRAQELAANEVSAPGPQSQPEPAQPTTETPQNDGAPQPNPVESVDQETVTAPPTAPPPRSGRTLSVVATAYCLKGTTATGLPVGPGIVAVDPGFIPLGTRMTIPGYGEGVAADTGGAIQGNRIDLWMPCPQANVYGSQTLTITLH